MNQQLKTVCVDDEFLALQLLEKYIGDTPELELVETFKSPMDALSFLKSNKVDLLFLDIQMPTLSGNSLLQILTEPPMTIFTTAYSEYAPEAFDLNAVDYLLKPFSFERFLQSVGKAQTFFQHSDLSAAAPRFIVVKVDGRTEKIYHKDILFIEGMKEYVRIHTKDQRFITLERLQALEGILPASTFLRVHKSFIVSMPMVTTMEGNLLHIGGEKIPVSRSRREAIYEMIFGKK